MRAIIATIMVLTCVIAAVAASGIDVYVDPIEGDDSNTGRSWEGALKTITRAAEIAGGRSASVHLAEGIFSEATGEVFPIVFERLALLSGQCPEKTIIDAGFSERILVSNVECYDDAEMCDLSVVRKGMVPWSDISGAAITLPWVDGYFDRVWFMDFGNIPIFGGVFNATFTSCRFSGPRQALFWHDLELMPAWLGMTDCIFEYSREPEAPPGWFVFEFVPYSYTVRIMDCRFTSYEHAADISVAIGSGPGYFINCSFENCDLRLDTSSSDSHCRGYIQGCSFRSTSLTISLTWYSHPGIEPGLCDVNLCAFDPDCAFVIESGQVTMSSSWFPVTPLINISDGMNYLNLSATSEEDPILAYGPLGGCYLSNVDSGQEVSSPCLGVAPAHWWREGLPPEGSTTRTDGVPDEAPYDIGYHYPSVPPPPPKLSIKTDRTEYVTGEEMMVYPSYENRGVKIEGAIYFAFGPESLDWLIFWPWMTFVPTAWVEGTLWSGVSYPNLPSTTHTIPDSLTPGHYLWLGAVLASDGSFASDLAIWPITITADSL